MVASSEGFGRVWEVLAAARASYLSAVSPYYDEVFWEVAERVKEAGCLGKADIGALVVWKRLSAQTRWASQLMSLPDVEVRGITARAVQAANDMGMSRTEAARAGRAVIWELPGLRHGDAMASAVLAAAAPERMAVYDRHAHEGLHALGFTLSSASGRYGRYMELLDRLLQEGGPRAAGWTARDVDTALYWKGGHVSADR